MGVRYLYKVGGEEQDGGSLGGTPGREASKRSARTQRAAISVPRPLLPFGEKERKLPLLPLKIIMHARTM